MGGVSGPELAAAVSAAGALGMLTAGPRSTADDLRRDVAATDARVGIGLLAWRLRDDPELLDVALEARPAAISISAGEIAPWAERVRSAGVPLFVQVPSAEAARERVGVGLLGWRIDEEPGLLELAIEAKPAAISISAGDSARHAARVREAGIPLFVQVGSAEAARAAIADFVVAQGDDAGGHARADVGTLPLLEAVLAAVDVPVLAAGGIASGRGLAGVLAMGAAGAWIGTRFAATVEARGSDEKKRRLLAARETDTVRTRAYDVAERLGWPPEIPGRVLRDEFTDRWHGREEKMAAAGAAPPGHVSAGPAVGAIDDLPPAGELVERMSAQADKLLRRFV